MFQVLTLRTRVFLFEGYYSEHFYLGPSVNSLLRRQRKDEALSLQAFVSELNFSAAYWLTSHMAIRGGYQLLWLDNLALAADAAARSITNPVLLNNVENDGHLFYNGATAGIDFVW